MTRLANHRSLLPSRCKALIPVVALALFTQAGLPQTPGGPPATLAPPQPGLLPVPLPQLDTLEASVAKQIRELQGAFADSVATPIAKAADLAESYGTLGQLYHAYELLDAAQACYRNASRLAPSDHRWLHLLGRLSQQQGKLEQAVTHLASARKADPAYAATPVRLGNTYLQLDRPGDARGEFEAALRLGPASPAAQAGLGEVALAERRYADAAGLFETALQQVPQANRLHYSLAMAYRGTGDLDKARSHLKQRGPVGVRPDDPLVEGLQDFLQGERVHLLQGCLAFSAGRFPEAARAFAEAVRAKPDKRTRPHQPRHGARTSRPIRGRRQAVSRSATPQPAEPDRALQPRRVNDEPRRPAADKANEAEMAVRLRKDLVRYEAGSPCRP